MCVSVDVDVSASGCTNGCGHRQHTEMHRSFSGLLAIRDNRLGLSEEVFVDIGVCVWMMGCKRFHWRGWMLV